MQRRVAALARRRADSASRGATAWFLCAPCRASGLATGHMVQLDGFDLLVGTPTRVNDHQTGRRGKRSHLFQSRLHRHELLGTEPRPVVGLLLHVLRTAATAADGLHRPVAAPGGGRGAIADGPRSRDGSGMVVVLMVHQVCHRAIWRGRREARPHSPRCWYPSRLCFLRPCGCGCVADEDEKERKGPADHTAKCFRGEWGLLLSLSLSLLSRFCD